MDADDGGIINIDPSDAEDDGKPDRTAQTEAEFQAVKQDYRVKVENGEIHESIKLPLDLPANKQRVQDVIHAIDELYFFRSYRDALDFIKTLYNDGSFQALDGDARKLMLVYEGKCRQKLDAPP